MWPHHTQSEPHTLSTQTALVAACTNTPSQQIKHFIPHSPRQRSLAIRHSYVSSIKLLCHSLRPPSIPIHKPNLVLPNCCPNHSTSQRTHMHRIHLSHSFVQGLERVNTNKQMGLLARWRAAAGSSPLRQWSSAIIPQAHIRLLSCLRHLG